MTDYDFEFDQAMDDAYGPSDPKSPSFLEALVDWVDMTRKSEKDDGPLSERDGAALPVSRANPHGSGRTGCNPTGLSPAGSSRSESGPDPDDPALD